MTPADIGPEPPTITHVKVPLRLIASKYTDAPAFKVRVVLVATLLNSCVPSVAIVCVAPELLKNLSHAPWLAATTEGNVVVELAVVLRYARFRLVMVILPDITLV